MFTNRGDFLKMMEIVLKTNTDHPGLQWPTELK